MDVYTTSFCLPRYPQLVDGTTLEQEQTGDATPATNGKHGHSLSRSSNGSINSSHKSSGQSSPRSSSASQTVDGSDATALGTTPKAASALREEGASRESSIDLGGPGTRRSTSSALTVSTEYSDVPSTSPTTAPSSVVSLPSNANASQKLLAELETAFQKIAVDSASQFSCIASCSTVDLMPPSSRQSSTDLSIAGPSFNPVANISTQPFVPSGQGAASMSSSTLKGSSHLTTNQLIILPENRGFHFALSGGYQQVMAARGAIIRDAPFKRKSIVKVARSEVIDVQETIRPEFKKKLDEIAALTKAHLAILGQSRDSEIHPSIVHGLDTEKYVEIVITGTYESVEQCRVRLLVLLDEMSGLHSDVCEIDHKLHNIIAGRKRAVIQTIQEETNTSIYFPSPLIAVLGNKNQSHINKQNLIFITGEFFGVQRARDMLYQVSLHKAKCIISRDTPILPRKLDWMLTERIEEIKAAMNDNGTFINFPIIGSQASMISVFGDHRVNIERTIRSIMQLACHFYIASFWLLPASFDVFMPPPSINPSHVPAILKSIAIQTGAEAVFKSNCFELHGLEHEVRSAVNLVSQLEQVKAFHHEIRFQIELANEHREFISGKKNGKLNKVMKSANVKIKFETFNDYNFLIDIAGPDGDALEGLSMLQEELPSEISFHVPESYHKRIIGVGGKNIQRIMKKFGVYVKFSNAEEFAALGGYIENDDNVVARTPAKNGANLENLKASVMELVSPRDKDFITETVSVPRRYHRNLLGEKAIFLHDIENKTNSSFRFPNKENASDAIGIFGPESQIHIAAQMLLVHIPFEADFKVPNSESLTVAAADPDCQKVIDRVKHDLNIVILPLLKPEGKDSIFRFCLNRSNVDFLATARDQLEEYLVSQKVEMYPGSLRPKVEPKSSDPFLHFNSALFSTAGRGSSSGQSSPVEAKGLFARGIQGNELQNQQAMNSQFPRTSFHSQNQNYRPTHSSNYYHHQNDFHASTGNPMNGRYPYASVLPNYNTNEHPIARDLDYSQHGPTHNQYGHSPSPIPHGHHQQHANGYGYPNQDNMANLNRMVNNFSL